MSRQDRRDRSQEQVDPYSDDAGSSGAQSPVSESFYNEEQQWPAYPPYPAYYNQEHQGPPYVPYSSGEHEYSDEGHDYDDFDEHLRGPRPAAMVQVRRTSADLR
jgi:hypothetical protein